MIRAVLLLLRACDFFLRQQIQNFSNVRLLYNQKRIPDTSKCRKCTFFLINLFSFYFWLNWVWVARCFPSEGFLWLVSRGYCFLWYTGLSLQRLLLLRSTGSRRTDFRSCGEWAYSCLENSMDRGAWRATSVPGVTRLGQVLANKSPLCEISPNQGSNSCLLYWQMDSYPLYHQGSPGNAPFKNTFW